MWKMEKSSTAANDRSWATSFCVLIMMSLVIDKSLASAYYFCETEIAHKGKEERMERERWRTLVTLTQRELFERCKEIFHWKFKTRKGGREACNPIRDGLDTFKDRIVDTDIVNLVRDVRQLMGQFDKEIRIHKLSPSQQWQDKPYLNAGRLASVFLSDFLES